MEEINMSELRYKIYSPQVIQETIEGEVIIVSLDSGNYYSLNKSGGEIWQLALDSYSQSEIIAALGARYQSGETSPGETVPEFLNQLVEHQLLRTSESPDAPRPLEDQNQEEGGASHDR